jgi:hypothetical protein
LHGHRLPSLYLPLNGAEIVMRTPKADDEQEGQEGGAQ